MGHHHFRVGFWKVVGIGNSRNGINDCYGYSLYSKCLRNTLTFCLRSPSSTIPPCHPSCLEAIHAQKLVKWGIKLWCLCEATSGYCLAFTVYTGAETGVDAVTHDLGYRVVMKLMQNVYADMSTPTTNSRRCHSTMISWLRIRTSYIIMS